MVQFLVITMNYSPVSVIDHSTETAFKLDVSNCYNTHTTGDKEHHEI